MDRRYMEAVACLFYLFIFLLLWHVMCFNISLIVVSLHLDKKGVHHKNICTLLFLASFAIITNLRIDLLSICSVLYWSCICRSTSSVEQPVITSNYTTVKSAVWRGTEQHSSRTIMWLESHSCKRSWEDTLFTWKTFFSCRNSNKPPSSLFTL